MSTPPLTERRLLELELVAAGPALVDRLRAEATDADRAGKSEDAERLRQRAQVAEHILAERERERAARKPVLPHEVDLFAGLAGIRLDQPEFEIGGGLVLRQTYAHVMGPYLLAFAPAQPGAPHPGPWRSTKGGGIGFDIHVELALPRDQQPTSFDRLNTLWWIVALLRLRQAVGIRVPVVSDTSFSAAPAR